MLKLLVVDDEKYDRESIIEMISTEFKDKFELYEARNGREAIEISDRLRPDIIIMDIRMPGINGLKAIQEIRKFLPGVYFIILTAYDYFDFAVEAVNNNVKEYILKPFSRSDIVEKILKAMNYVHLEKRKRIDDIENQEKLYNLMPVIENELSFAIINNSLRAIDFNTYVKYLDFEFKNTCSMVVQIKFQDWDEEVASECKRLQIGDYIKEFISRKYKNIASFRFTKDLVYFIHIKGLEDEEDIKLCTINLATDIRREVKRIYNISIRIGIGNCYNDLEHLHKSYKEACKVLSYDQEKNNIIHIKESNEYVKDNNPTEKQGIFEGEKVALFKSVEQYIKDNIKEELDLEKTASRFNLSIYYFSRTFKEILGYNFSDYVNIIRINKAKHILKNESMSIKEACYTVGYSDPNYFSKVFKKYEGISPTEYKLRMM